MQKKAEDLCWVVDFELDKDNCLTHLLWMLPDQVDLWLRYYDVIVNDNIARTNQYQIPLEVFIILNCIKSATNQTPIIMFTDANPALDATIPIVLPETYAAYCIFHITQNLPKNLKLKLGENWDNFIKQFYQCRNSLFGIESTVKVEGYNWIIKQQLKANSTLCETADRFDSRLNDEKR
ncbi:protein FAR1-related sequence 11-like [Rhizophagus clarus]|uniref:Protein FAR1-related sequence 11-like n=1 Tax=Rhizophagus clarus TaxID=94130 RepID=A0A8H3KSC2_9GLOM|nr:protein FAR1-related sequence 11-like [Rhizophagus clarus]